MPKNKRKRDKKKEGVPPGNHGFQPNRPCNRAQGSADAFGFGPYHYAGTTASSQEDHVFSQLIARSIEDIRANIWSFLGDQQKMFCLRSIVCPRRCEHL